MKYSIRPTSAADAAAIVRLLGEAGLRANVEPQDLQWKYWRPRPDWPGPRSFVLTDDSDLIAHAAVVPAWCVWGTQRAAFLHLVDWAARAGVAGAGITLMKQIGRQVQGLLATGGSAQTLQILPHLGFRPLGVATGYVRTLFPLRLLRVGGIRPSKLVPRVARSIAWTLVAPSVHSAEWQVHRLSGDDVQRVSAVLPVPARGMVVMERSVALFRHMLECPIAPMSLFGVERSGRLRGYFLLASAPGQVRIADCWMDSNEPADWRALILCAVEQARCDPQAAEVVIWANDPLLTHTLLGCGFHARGETPIQMRPADEDSMPPAPLRVQMLDSDAAFMHSGRSECWA